MDDQDRLRLYTKETLERLGCLLRLYPRGRDQIATDYPGVLGWIKSDFAKNVSPSRSAIFGAAAILKDLVGILEIEQRLLTLRQVQRLDMRQFQADLDNWMAGEDTFPQEMYFLTVVIGAALVTANSLVEDREIEQADCDLFTSEIRGALASEDAPETADVQFKLWVKYCNGEGVPQDHVEAAYWLSLAADQGYAEAQYNLGVMYLKGLLVPQDNAKAASWFRFAAQQGHAKAQYDLGAAYGNGYGVPQDSREAARCYRLAAEQGFARAQRSLAVMYAKGEGVTRDYITAAKWCRLAADQGLEDAQRLLGAMYDDGRGVPQNHAEAVKWYRLAAEQGKPRDQFLVGHRYAHGKGVPKSYTEAVRWYQLAAEQGFAKAQLNLGLMYALGKGVPQDLVRAHMWFSLSAVSGDQDARKVRDTVAREMTGTQIAEAQKLAAEWKPKS